MRPLTATLLSMMNEIQREPHKAKKNLKSGLSIGIKLTIAPAGEMLTFQVGREGLHEFEKLIKEWDVCLKYWPDPGAPVFPEPVLKRWEGRTYLLATAARPRGLPL